MFFKLVRFDLRNGLAAEWKKFLTALIVFLGFFSLQMCIRDSMTTVEIKWGR